MTVCVARRVVLCTAIALMAASPASAKHKAHAEPVHNYVDFDLTPSVPAPPVNGFRDVVQLVDSASATRNGDIVSFDVLMLNQVVGTDPHTGGPAAVILHRTYTYVVSCGWQTERMEPHWDRAGERGFHSLFFDDQAFRQDVFLGPRSWDRALFEPLCAHRPLHAAPGFKSVDAAIAAWQDDFRQLPPTNVITAIRAISQKPPHPAWMEGTAPHRFVAIARDAARGNVLFIDMASRQSDGDRATALTFALLGPDAQHFGIGFGSVAILRNVRYDCAANTMTVAAHAGWDRLGTLTGLQTMDAPSRSAADSSVTASEIRAACTGEVAADGPSFASTDEAWADAVAHMPPPPQLAWTACVWGRMSVERQASLTANWRNSGPLRHAQLTRAEIGPWLAACGIGEAFEQTVSSDVVRYAEQRGALQDLAAKNLTEAQLLTAWKNLSWSDRQRFVRTQRAYTQDDLSFQTHILAQLAMALGPSINDGEAMADLQVYFSAQGWIESG